MDNFQFRRAVPDESQVLTNLAIQSKAHWSYSEAFMKECEVLLHIPSDRITHDHVYVMLIQDHITGFYALVQNGEKAWLEDFFLDPTYIGEGLGKRMWYHMVSVARHHSIETIEWDSDPYAAPFYERMGAVKIGDTASGANQRTLPKYQYHVSN